MSQTIAVWIVIVAALIAANLPFFNQRFLGVVQLANGKSLALRLAELVLLYFTVGGVALLLEKNAGQIAAQGWEFYAVTGTLFLVFAFPGFIWQFLWNHGRH